MSDAIWFYAKNDQQKGPVTPAQLKVLAASGEVLPTDLVWKEGMEDWAPASEVKGLFSNSTRPSAEPTPEGSPVATVPAEASAASTTGPKQDPVPVAATTPASGSARWASPPPAPSSGQLDLQAVPEPPPAVTSSQSTTAANPTKSRVGGIASEPHRHEPHSSAIPAGLFPALVGFGLLLVLTSRGCDALGDRYAARLVARYELSKARFDDEWSLKRKELEAKRDAALASPDEGLIKQQAVEEAQTSLAQLSTEVAKEKQRLEQQRWHAMSIAARDAAAENVAWSYWRQLVMLPASLILVAGLLGVGITHTGPERWIALGSLLVIAYSLFVGGDAWK